MTNSLCTDILPGQTELMNPQETGVVSGAEINLSVEAILDGAIANAASPILHRQRAHGANVNISGAIADAH